VTHTRAREASASGSRLTGRDLLRVASFGLRSRRLRTALSALGISIGIGAIVGVLGISQSSKTGLLNELGQLGNLITVQSASPGSELPVTADGMTSRIGPVTSISQIASISGTYVYRTPLIPAIDTNGITLTAADPALPATAGATLAHGTFLNTATARYPAVALGAETAGLLGIYNLASPTQVWIGGRWFTVVGILNPVPDPVEQVTPMDDMAFIGFPIAEQDFAFDGHPTDLYVRSTYTQVSAVATVLPATRQPRRPRKRAGQLPVRRPGSRDSRQGSLQRAVPGPGCRRPARRRRRHRQRHGYLRPGTPLRDRPAPCPRRHPAARR
jgi:putative ABC transport system permease protein